MLKDYLVPMSFWIAKKTNIKKPYIVGLTGGQGTGKTTIKYYGKNYSLVRQ